MPDIGKLTMTLAALAVLGAGCMGNVMTDDGGGAAPAKPGVKPGDPPGDKPGDGKPAEATPPGPNVPGPAVFRRLTRAEYNNTVRDLIGDATNPAESFPSDTLAGQSGFNRGGAVSGVDANRIYEATDKMVGAAIGTRLGTLLPCGQAPAAVPEQDKCAQDFITKFGRRAFRRPLTGEEAGKYGELYQQLRNEAKSDFPGAIRTLLAAMLLSPNFLYRWETVTQGIVRDGEFLRFNGYEMASRLSYGLWATMPDEALFTAAENDKLATPEQIEGEVRRMMKDGKARDALADFVVQWLDISDLKDQQKSPEYTNYNAAVAAAMLEETKTFIGNIVHAGDGKLTTLLTAKKSYINEGLAKIYGAGGVTGTALKESELNGSQRAGILTHGSFLAAHGKAAESGPMLRGKTVADRLLCKDLPPPPDNVEPPPEAMDGVTTRQRFEMHSKADCAKTCHSVIDPLGFAYENYDAVGQWRDMDSGKPVNAASSLPIDGKNVSFANAVELAGILAGSKEASACMSKQFLRYMLRRQEVQGDASAITGAHDTFSRANYDVRELMVALTKSKSFTHRTATAGELLP